MRIAIICDSHFGVRANSPIFHDYFERCFKTFFQTIDAEGVSHVLHLGDVFDRRKELNFVTANRCRRDFLEPLAQRRLESHVIAGNHDTYYKDTNLINALDEVIGTRYPNIHCYIDPKLITIDGLNIQLVPWIAESNYAQSMDVLDNPKAEICMGHFEVSGMHMSSSTTCDLGLDRGRLHRFDAVYSGHFHHMSSADNLHYLGAFSEHIWSDFADPRGFHILDTETRNLTHYLQEETIFKMVVYDDVKDPDILQTIANTDWSYLKNCYVKVVCVNKTNLYAFDQLLDALYKVQAADITTIENEQAFHDNLAAEEIDQSEDTPTILSRYIEGLTLPVEIPRMKTFMLDIYKEALVALEK